eukprot:jgi/Bigna1/67419/fgenesh1_pg.3_\
MNYEGAMAANGFPRFDLSRFRTMSERPRAMHERWLHDWRSQREALQYKYKYIGSYLRCISNLIPPGQKEAVTEREMRVLTQKADTWHEAKIERKAWWNWRKMTRISWEEGKEARRVWRRQGLERFLRKWKFHTATQQRKVALNLLAWEHSRFALGRRVLKDMVAAGRACKAERARIAQMATGRDTSPRADEKRSRLSECTDVTALLLFHCLCADTGVEVQMALAHVAVRHASEEERAGEHLESDGRIGTASLGIVCCRRQIQPEATPAQPRPYPPQPPPTRRACASPPCAGESTKGPSLPRVGPTPSCQGNACVAGGTCSPKEEQSWLRRTHRAQVAGALWRWARWARGKRHRRAEEEARARVATVQWYRTMIAGTMKHWYLRTCEAVNLTILAVEEERQREIQRHRVAQEQRSEHKEEDLTGGEDETDEEALRPSSTPPYGVTVVFPAASAHRSGSERTQRQ